MQHFVANRSGLGWVGAGSLSQRPLPADCYPRELWFATDGGNSGLGVIYQVNEAGTAWLQRGVKHWDDLEGKPTTFTPSDASVTNAKVAAGAGIAESKLALASDAVAGTPSRRTLGTGAQQAAAGNDSRFADTRTPTDGTVTDAKVAANAGIAESKLALASDAATTTPSRRTLGTGAQQAAAGTHDHTNRVPTSRQVASGTGLAGGGDLSVDRTLRLADVVGLTPGQYERATVTVDAQGRITAIGTGAAGAVADASTTVKGASRLTVSPVNAIDPLVVGDNDSRMAKAASVGVAQYCRVERDAIQNVPNASNTTISWDVEASDSAGWFSTADRTRVTVTETGLYFVSGQALFTSSTNGNVRSYGVAINGTLVSQGQLYPQVDQFGRPNVAVPLFLAAGDYVSVIVFQDSGGALSFGGQTNTARPTPFLTVARIK